MKREREKIKDRPRRSQTGRQKKRNSCIYLIVAKIARTRWAGI